jgi:hypothetical protein
MDAHRRPLIDCPRCGQSYRETAIHCPGCGEVNPLHDRPPARGEWTGWAAAAIVLAAVCVGAFFIVKGAVVEPLAFSGEVDTMTLGLGCLLTLAGLIVHRVRKWLQ